jgi:hypothetical protein
MLCLVDMVSMMCLSLPHAVFAVIAAVLAAAAAAAAAAAMATTPTVFPTRISVITHINHC